MDNRHQHGNITLSSLQKRIHKMLDADWFYHRQKYLQPILTKLIQLKKQISQNEFLDSSFQHTNRLNSFKLYLMRKNKKTQQFLQTMDHTNGIENSMIQSKKKSHPQQESFFNQDFNQISQQYLKKKILQKLKTLLKLCHSYDMIIKQLENIPISDLKPQSQHEFQWINLSLIQIWSSHIQKISLIQSMTVWGQQQKTMKMKTFVEENSERQVRQQLEKYKFWQLSCFKIINDLIRQIKRFMVFDQKSNFDKSKEFTNEISKQIAKKSILSSLLKNMPARQESNWGQKSLQILNEKYITIGEKQKNMKFIKSSNKDFVQINEKGKRSKKQIKVKDNKNGICGGGECLIF